jgi:SAM-dependent methyltransferase
MSLPGSYFDDLYTGSADPWGLATRSYEARKYALSVASLPRLRYRRVFEPGCSIGVLTRMLAERADTVVASDVSPAALATARRDGLPANVSLERAAVPDEWPDGRFDLIVLSELGYYLDESDLATFIRRSRASLDADGHLLAVHWRKVVSDYPRNAAAVHRQLRSSGLRSLARYTDEYFLLEVFGASAQAELTGPESGDRASRR